jgi:glutamate--cysteine ligase
MLTTLTSPDWLIAPFRAGCKGPGERRIGMEVEVQGVCPHSGHRLPFDGPQGIEAVLKLLAISRGWIEECEGAHVIGLHREGETVTIEPGGQVELSTAPRATLAEVEADYRRFLADLDAVAELLDIQWSNLAVHPLDPVPAVPWVPKGRYAFLSEHLAATGPLSHHMMKLTSGVQVCLDYRSERECFDIFRTIQGLVPIVGALTGNSPFVEGARAPAAIYRRHIWRHTDPRRCGLLLDAHARPDFGFADYVNHLLDVPMPFLRRGVRWFTADGHTFREFLADGIHGLDATPEDWALHGTSLFTEVRLKNFVEVRCCDHPGVDRVIPLAALWVGLLYDDEARHRAWEIAASWSPTHLDEIDRASIADGMAAAIDGAPLADLARYVVQLAGEGLERIGEDPDRLAPLRELVARGRCPGDEVLEVACDADGGLRIEPWLAFEAARWRHYVDGPSV